MTFEELVVTAKKYINPKQFSPFIEGGQVASAILTEDGNVYVGICILTKCSQGTCAERNAIQNMLTHNETKIKKLVCVDKSNQVRLPCGACREYLMQLDKESKEIQILTDMNTGAYVTLKELHPGWWGEGRFDN